MAEIDLDELIGNKKLTFKYKGKKYVVQDLTIKDVLSLAEIPKNQDTDVFNTVTEQLQVLLGCSKDEVQSIGIKAANKMIRDAYDFFFEGEAEVEKEKEKTKL